MKHLFFVAVAGGIFSGTTISVKAQTNANIERFQASVQPKISPKFIESIEIIPAGTSNILETVAEMTKPGKPAVTRPAVTVPAVIKSVTVSAINTIEHSSSLQFKYAIMLDREVENITNFSLYRFIDDWWATSYQYGGTDSNGIDCSAFTSKLLSEVYGLTIPRTARDQYKICRKLATKNLVEGDLVFFNTRGGISHVGLYLGNNYFVHSSVHDGVKISSLKDEYYKRKFISGGRVLPSPKFELLKTVILPRDI